MNNQNEVINALKDAAATINSLRKENAILAAKVEVMDLFACVLYTTPATRNQPMEVDAAWLCERLALKLACNHRNVSRGDDETGTCQDCGCELHYDSESRNWESK